MFQSYSKGGGGAWGGQPEAARHQADCELGMGQKEAQGVWSRQRGPGRALGSGPWALHKGGGEDYKLPPQAGTRALSSPPASLLPALSSFLRTAKAWVQITALAEPVSPRRNGGVLYITCSMPRRCAGSCDRHKQARSGYRLSSLCKRGHRYSSGQGQEAGKGDLWAPLPCPALGIRTVPPSPEEVPEHSTRTGEAGGLQARG